LSGADSQLRITEITKMGKGITLNKEKLIQLKELLNSIDLEDLEID
jgi:hypothetical protein